MKTSKSSDGKSSMVKTAVPIVVWTVAIIAWIGIFVPPKIDGTAVKAQRVETICYTDCLGHFNGHRQLEHE